MKNRSQGRKQRLAWRGGGSDHAHAFFPDPRTGPARVSDDLAEALAEGYLVSATSAEESGEEAHELQVEEETGGPFVLSTAKREFAHGADPSNPRDAERAPFPLTGSFDGGLVLADASDDDDDRSPPRETT
jgi:hypothetical protein